MNIGLQREEFNQYTTVAFDVDWTLITEDYKPIYENIMLFKTLQKLGCLMTIWSGGGIDYAKQWGDKLGLQPFSVSEKGSFEPDIVFDDMDYAWKGKVVIKV